MSIRRSRGFNAETITSTNQEFEKTRAERYIVHLECDTHDTAENRHCLQCSPRLKRQQRERRET